MKIAQRFVMGECDDEKCQALHFWLFDSLDENAEPFAVMTIAVEDVPEVTNKMRDVAYAKSAMRG